MLFATRRTREQMFVLALFLSVEILLAAIVIYASLNESVDVPEWQLGVFGGVLLWIYIWYLKGHVRDSRERHLDERIKAHTLIECLPDGIVILEADGGVLAWNAAASRILGVPVQATGRLAIGDFLEPASAEALGRHGFGELRVSLRGGRPACFFLVPLHAGDGRGERIVILRGA